MNISSTIYNTVAYKLSSIVLAFLASIFLTRLLGPTGQGIYTYVQTSASLLFIFLGFNSLQTLTYNLAKFNEKKANFVGLSFIIFTISTMTTIVLLLTLYHQNSSYLYFFLPDTPYTSTLVFFILIIFIKMYFESIAGGMWQGLNQFKTLNRYTVLNSFLTSLAYFFIWFYYKDKVIDIDNIFYLLTIILSLILLSNFFYFYKKLDFRISFNYSEVLKKYIFYSLPASGIIIINFLNKRIDIWFIEYFYGIEQLGFYGLGANISDRIIGLLLSVTYVLSPYLTKNDKYNAIQLLAKFSRILSSFAVIGIILFIVISPLLISTLYGDEFQQSILPLQILTLSALVILIRNVFAIYNVATNQLKDNIIGSLISLFFTIVLDFLLIPKYGIIGASVASLISYLSGTLWIVLKVIIKNRHISINYFFITPKDVSYITYTIINKFKNAK